MTAVEPAAALRDAAHALHKDRNIVWIDDRLPTLSRLTASPVRFDRVLVSGVWQHLDADQRRGSLAALAKILANDGMILLSFRHGPGAPGRATFDLPVAQTRAAVADAGLRIVAERAAASIQPENRAAGVTWTWFAFRRDTP